MFNSRQTSGFEFKSHKIDIEIVCHAKDRKGDLFVEGVVTICHLFGSFRVRFQKIIITTKKDKKYRKCAGFTQIHIIYTLFGILQK
jgi:hypothetical protein